MATLDFIFGSATAIWYFQYGREPGVMTDLIWRAAKTKFNSEDYGVITVDTTIVIDE